MLQYRLPYYLVCCIAFPVLLASCATYTASNGKKYRQFAPVKDRMISADIDTGKYMRSPFSIQNHEHKTATINNKRVVVDFSGDDVQLIKESGREYLIYFWNAYCSGTTKAINTLDSLNLSGKNVIIASLRSDYNRVSTKLEKKSFSKHPYYFIEDGSYSNLLLNRIIDFIKDACPDCYNKDKDEVMFCSYLYVKGDSVKVVYHTDEDNVLK